ncbi:MAG: hypothetical protein KDD73_15020 [Anaerolineales bacterium]|nr:hypothetical protein [Anaerolineales bacterium]
MKERDRMARTIVEVLHDCGIRTWHMSPAPLAVECYVGPTTITLQVRLADAERDLASALQIGPAVAQALDGHQPRLWANGEALFVRVSQK